MRKKQNTKKEETSWGGVASWYSDLLEENDDTYQKQVIGPNMLRIMKNLEGKKVLDLACGTGFFTRMFAEAGMKVVGSDIGSELIAEAKRLSPGKIEYAVSPGDKLPFESMAYDGVAVVLALQNIENVKGVFEEAFRVLKSGGRLFVVLNHPSFRIPKNSSWQYDEKEEKQYRRIDVYLSESKVEIDMNPGNSKSKSKTISFHRPLQYYTKLLHNSGFMMRRIEEWQSHKESQPGKRAAEENRIRKEIPMFLFIEAIKI